MKKIMYIICCILISAACGKSSKQEKVVERTQVVGNDKDDHGCIESAGYQWSEVMKECIRPFERGIRLTNVKYQEMTTVAYVVFNADSSKAELFLPKMTTHPILTRVQKLNDKKMWETSGSEKWTLYMDCKETTIRKAEEILYRQETK